MLCLLLLIFGFVLRKRQSRNGPGRATVFNRGFEDRERAETFSEGNAHLAELRRRSSHNKAPPLDDGYLKLGADNEDIGKHNRVYEEPDPQQSVLYDASSTQQSGSSGANYEEVNDHHYDQVALNDLNPGTPSAYSSAAQYASKVESMQNIQSQPYASAAHYASTLDEDAEA